MDLTTQYLGLELEHPVVASAGPLFSAVIKQEASARDDILHALLALGYNEREAAAAIKPLPADASVNDGIRLALKSLAKV